MKTRGPKTGTKYQVLADVILEGKPLSLSEIVDKVHDSFPKRSRQDTRLTVQRSLNFAVLLGAVHFKDGKYFLSPLWRGQRNVDKGEGSKGCAGNVESCC